MRETISIPSLGSLAQHNRYEHWWESEKEIKVPFFDNLPIKFTVMAEKNDINEDFDRAINNFLQLGENQRLEASKYVFKNYSKHIEAVGEDEFDFKVNNKNDIWNYVHPTAIYVRKRAKDNLVYVQIAAECDWEIEHGLQIIYKDGCKLSRVSAQDGHITHSDAYGLPESEDKIC